MADALTAEQARLWRAYRHGYERLAEALARQLSAAAGLSPPEFRVLALLDAFGPGGAAERGVPQADVLAATHWDKSRLSHLLRRMEARGLIARRGAGTRGAEVAATTEGRVRHRAAEQAHARTLRAQFFDPLRPHHLAALAEALDRLAPSAPAGPDVAVRTRRDRARAPGGVCTLVIGRATPATSRASP